MSTEHLNENQQSLYNTLRLFESLGGSEGYLASLEAAKSSSAPSLPEIAAGNQRGTAHIKIVAMPWPENYSVTVILEGEVDVETYNGLGWAHATLKPGDYKAEWILIDGAKLDDLLPSETPASWYPGGKTLVGMVFSPGQQPLVHILNGPLGTGLENTKFKLKWTKLVVG